jgi:preprotein translocase subunit SecG
MASTFGVYEVIVTLFASLVTTLFGLALALTAIFLILLVLVQRGRGGGLAGALGGMGGSSAFGAKAGDIFTRITIGAASVWIVLCIAAAKFSTPSNDLIDMPLNQGANSTMNASSEEGSLEDIKPQDTADTTGNSSQNEQDPATATASGESANENSANGKSASSTESPASPASDSPSPASP